MPVDAFRLENFMAFEDTGWIELRKINLLLGRNSSGKSAIIRALRLMKQSWLNEEEAGQSLTFRIEGGVDVGSFDSVRHRVPAQPLPQSDANDDDLKQQEVEDKQWEREQVRFSYRGHLSLTEFEEITWAIFFARATRGALPEDYAVWKNTTWTALQILLRKFEASEQERPIFHVGVSYKLHKTTNQCYAWKYDLGVCQTLGAGEFAPVCGFEVIAENWGFFDVYEYLKIAPDTSVPLEDIFKRDSYTRFLPDLNSFNALPDSEQRQSLECVEVFGQVCRKIVTNWLESIVHVGPIRPLPRRSYALTEEYRREYELGGWQAFFSFLKFRNRDLETKTNRWIEELKLGKKLDRDGIGFRDGVYEIAQLRIDETGNGSWRELVDVGFGASQIIPIILQCQAADGKAFILIEQPELHLHPEAQADIADMFIESAYALRDFRSELHPRRFSEAEKRLRLAQQEEKPEPVNRCYLIETHSEHLLLRTERRIAETTYEEMRPDKGGELANDGFGLKPFDFGLVHVNRANGKSAVEYLEADKYGLLLKPSELFQDFFKYDYEEVVQLNATIAKIKKLEHKYGKDNND